MIQEKTAIDEAEQLVQNLIPDHELCPTSLSDVWDQSPFYEKMKACSRRCNQPYSEVDHALQDALVLRRLQQMVHSLRLNPLWKERIEAAGLKGAPRNYEEWQQIPITDKKTLSDYYMGKERPGLVIPLSYGGFEIVASGGTSSGTPAETVYTLKELKDTYEIAGEFMGKYQLPPYLPGDDPKWMITTLADYQMWSSGTMVGGVLERIPGTNYIGAGPISQGVFQHMMSYKGPKAIMGAVQSIAMLRDLGEGLDEEARNSLRVAMYGSGILAHKKQSDLKKFYPNIDILSYFAATQAETIGLQLDANSPILTAVPGLHLIEIVDDEGKWVGEGEEGELVVTRLHAHRAPLPRYRLGDRMIRRPSLNGPGLKAQQFEFAGRSGDIIHIDDKHYAVPQAYSKICEELNRAVQIDLQALAHTMQFVNDRADRVLYLYCSVDDPGALNTRMENQLGETGIQELFMDALNKSLPLFNEWGANVQTLQKTGYRFEIRLVHRNAPEIHQTVLGKIPMLRDII